MLLKKETHDLLIQILTVDCDNDTNFVLKAKQPRNPCRGDVYKFSNLSDIMGLVYDRVDLTVQDHIK